MNTKKYRWLLYIITLTVIATITVQIYWNYKNYQQNKQHIVNEIQLSLDNALEEYFAGLVKSDFLTIIEKDITNIDSSYFNHSTGNFNRKTLSINAKSIDSTFKDISIDINSKSAKKIKFPSHISSVRVIKGFQNSDSTQLLKNLKTVFISISNNPVEYKKLDSLLKNQLKNKNLNINYSLNHVKGDSLFFKSNHHNFTLGHWKEITMGDSITFKSTKNNIKFNWNNVSSKSTYLKNNEQYNVLFKDSSFEALKRSSTGILLSFLLSLAIISCLFYLMNYPEAEPSRYQAGKIFLD